MENIRKMNNGEAYDVLDLWMRSFTAGHPFIEDNFWEKYYSSARDLYINEKDTYVYTYNDKVVGFISVAVDGTIRGIYVDPEYHNRRIGTKLAKFVQDMYMGLNMEIYKKNRKALDYATYLGFIIVSANVKEENDEICYKLSWSR